MSKKWTEDKIEQCIDILKRSKSVRQALRSIKTIDGLSGISSNALRKAFNRYGYESPSFYCYEYEQEEGGEDDDVDSTFDFGREFDWEIDYDNKEYICKKGDKTERIPFHVIEDVVILYCNPFPGQGKTKQEVVDYLIDRSELNLSLCLVSQAWKRLFDKYNIDKANQPVAPHLDGEDNDEVMKHVYDRGDTLRKKLVKDKYNKVRHLERSLEQQYKRLLDFREIFQLAQDSDVAEKAAYKIDYKEKDFSNDSALWLAFIADLHAGKEELFKILQNTDNEYNREVFRERVKRGIEKQIEAFRRCEQEVEEVVLGNAGDNFEAFLENMRKGQGLQMYGDPKTNYDDVIWANAAFIRAYAEETDDDVTTRFVAVGGNHDRFMEDKGPDSEDFMIHIICEHLKSIFEDRDDVEIIEGAPVSSMLLPNNINLIMLHGHHKSMRRSNIEDLVSIHGYDQADRYLAVQGHLHRFEIFPTKSDKGMGMILPSFVGGTDFSSNANFKDSKAKTVCIKSTANEEQVIGPFDIEG